MSHMTDADWQKYYDVINTWQQDAFQEPFNWFTAYSRTHNYGEDSNIRRWKVKELKGLIQYNYFRSWPMTQSTDAGEMDKESILLYINIAHLASLNALNEHSQFVLNPGLDRFVVRGRVYKAQGDSHAAQAKDRPLFVFIILKREETETAQDLFDNADNVTGITNPND